MQSSPTGLCVAAFVSQKGVVRIRQAWHAGLLLHNLSVIRGLELMFDSFDIPDRAAGDLQEAMQSCLVSSPLNDLHCFARRCR